MTVKTYKPRRIGNPFEQEVFQYLSNVLERSPDEYILFGPVRIDQRELDGLIIGNGFMVALEAKAVHGRVSMTANAPLTVTTADGETVSFDERYEDPYDQAENHWKKLASFMRNTFGETDFWFVTMLVLQPGSTFDVPPTARDVYSGNSLTVALDEVPAFLDRLSSRLTRFHLTQEQQDALVKAVAHGADRLTGAEKRVFARFSPAPWNAPVSSSSTPPSTPLPRKISRERPTGPATTSRWRQVPPPPRKPWYHSGWFLWFAFLFLNPVWAFLMLRDRGRGWFVKLLATFFLLAELIVCLGALYYVQMNPWIIGLPQAILARTGTPAPAATAAADLSGPTPVPTAQAEASPDAGDVCTIVWVETDSEDLADKNRADVWAQILRPRLAGSGMTDRQFYAEVVERNPVLEEDGYVFQEAKTYLLPACE